MLEPVQLSPTEFRLLHYLLLNSGRVVSKAQILQHVWQYASVATRAWSSGSSATCGASSTTGANPHPLRPRIRLLHPRSPLMAC